MCLNCMSRLICDINLLVYVSDCWEKIQENVIADNQSSAQDSDHYHAAILSWSRPGDWNYHVIYLYICPRGKVSRPIQSFTASIYSQRAIE